MVSKQTSFHFYQTQTQSGCRFFCVVTIPLSVIFLRCCQGFAQEECNINSAFWRCDTHLPSSTINHRTIAPVESIVNFDQSITYYFLQDSKIADCILSKDSWKKNYGKIRFFKNFFGKILSTLRSKQKNSFYAFFMLLF